MIKKLTFSRGNQFPEKYSEFDAMTFPSNFFSSNVIHISRLYVPSEITEISRITIAIKDLARNDPITSLAVDRHRQIRMNRKTKRKIERGKEKKSESEGYMKEN